MKRTIALIIILSLLLSGCWDSIDPEKLGLVTLMGIDIADSNRFEVTVQEFSYQGQASADKNGGSGGKMPGKLHRFSAQTISEAVQNIMASDFLRTYFAHTSAIILSEELARSEGISPSLIDHLERSPEIRRNTWILIAESDQFDKIFSAGSSVEPGIDTGRVIGEIILNKSKNSSIATNKLGEFLNLYWEKGSEPFTSGIGLIPISTDKAGQAKSTGSDEINEHDFNIGNTAVFKDGKLSGWLDTNESIGLLWVRGGIKGGIIQVKSDGSDLSLEIVKAASHIKPVIIDEEIQINIHIDLISKLNESQVNIDFQDKEVIDRIENMQALGVKKQILAAFNKTKSLNSDVFGFGNCIFGSYPDYWKEIESSWYDYYRDLKLNIDISSTVNHVGLVRRTRE